MTKPTMFITGGSGMLGRVLIRYFKQFEHRIIAPPQTEFNLLKPTNKFPKSDIVIHCAALTSVDECQTHQKICHDINVRGTEFMVRLARRWNARLLFVSTPMVFSGKRGNYREHNRTSPANYYGWTKREGERIVLKYRHGMVIRSNPIGVRPTGSFPSFIQWFVDAAKSNRSFDLFKDVLVNPISTETFATVLLSIIERSEQDRILHIGSRDVVSKAEIWEHILKHFPYFSGAVRPVSVDDTAIGRATTRPKEMWLNVDRIQNAYNIPMPSWYKEVDTVLKELGI